MGQECNSVYLILFLTFLMGSSAFPQDRAKYGETSTDEEVDHAKVYATLEAHMTEYGGVGLSVAVVKYGRIIYHSALGVKDRSSGDSLWESDILRLDSISKTFVASAIMQLVEANNVSLDDDVSGLIGFAVRNPLYP